MGAWGYIFLAYGIVWGAILVYFVSLKARLRKAESDLAQLRLMENAQDHAKK
jgi:CcmD family protein